MPTSSKRRLCNRCRRIVTGACPTCDTGWIARPPKSWDKGSDRRWRKVRADFLRENPWCQWPGCDQPADQADHIDGTDYATERYDPTKLRALCTPHHRERTAQQGNAASRGISPDA